MHHPILLLTLLSKPFPGISEGHGQLCPPQYSSECNNYYIGCLCCCHGDLAIFSCSNSPHLMNFFLMSKQNVKRLVLWWWGWWPVVVVVVVVVELLICGGGGLLWLVMVMMMWWDVVVGSDDFSDDFSDNGVVMVLWRCCEGVVMVVMVLWWCSESAGDYIVLILHRHTIKSRRYSIIILRSSWRSISIPL